MFILILFVSLLPDYAEASTITSSAKTGITNGNLRYAYNKAVQNALINAIKGYYRQNSENAIEVTAEFVKFIKSYSIINQNINDKSVEVTLKVSLDDDALQDARLIVSHHTDSAVYLQRGISADILPSGEIRQTISKILSSKQFSLKDETKFLDMINNPSLDNQIQEAFKKTESQNMFIFDFTPVTDTEEFENDRNKCEILTHILIFSKKGDNKNLKITTGSLNTTPKYCYSEAIAYAVDNAVAYVRENIIQIPDTSPKLQKYNIKCINFTNMVATKNLLDTLLQRGIIKSSKPISYSQKSIIFEVESFFNTEELDNKIQTLSLSQKPKSSFTKKEFILDFSGGQ